MKIPENLIAAFAMIAMTASTVLAHVKIGTNPITIKVASDLYINGNAHQSVCASRPRLSPMAINSSIQGEGGRINPYQCHTLCPDNSITVSKP